MTDKAIDSERSAPCSGTIEMDDDDLTINRRLGLTGLVELISFGGKDMRGSGVHIMLGTGVAVKLPASERAKSSD